MNDIDVQSLIDRIKSSVNDRLTWHLFQPNDDLTRRQLETAVSHYLEGLMKEQVISDFGVVCSEANNPPMSQDNGELIVDFFIRPISFTDNLIHFHAPLTKGLSMATVPSFPATGTNGQQLPLWTASTTSNLLSAVGQNITTSAPSTSPDLPKITLRSFDQAGNRVEMILEPESNLSAHEALKLTMLLICGLNVPHEFSSYEYVRKNDLERHFKFKRVA